VTETWDYIATVAVINLRRREAALRLPEDSTRKFAVHEDADLFQRKVGGRRLDTDLAL